LTTQNFIKNKPVSWALEDFKTRKKSLVSYLKQKGYLNKSKIMALNDIYGNSDKDLKFDVIFVTEAGIRNAITINKRRQKNNLPPLKIITVQAVYGKDGKVISSTRIRAGEIDRTGRPYVSFFTGKTALHLPPSLREKLRIPLGKIIKDSIGYKRAASRGPFIISVGDIVTLKLLDSSIKPDVSIIDFKSKRQEIDSAKILKLLSAPVLSAINAPGTISKDASLILFNAIQKALSQKERFVIRIEGEEDLLTLAAILLAPLKAIVFYGQIDVGGVAVPVTEQKKRQVISLLKRFN
jgi:uncharacterized protein (UPF0218 family)/phosphopantetheine adenylyltransferase